ncbi:MAG: DUF3575 domain-containing protein [Nitrosomonadales bacterium]|nr:DUF3575 domain-containing protein [Nitrosomonadales bacterium]
MKKIILAGTALTLAMAAGSAAAAPAAGTFGLNVDLNSDFKVTGKYFVAKDMAVLGGLGLSIRDNGSAANSKSTDIGFMFGARKYLKTDDFAPFIGGRLTYSTTRDVPTGGTEYTDFGIGFETGAEYFLGKQFSLEGKVGFGYASHEFKTVGAATSTKMTALGSSTAALSANFYF